MIVIYTDCDAIEISIQSGVSFILDKKMKCSFQSNLLFEQLSKVLISSVHNCGSVKSCTEVFCVVFVRMYNCYEFTFEDIMFIVFVFDNFM